MSETALTQVQADALAGTTDSDTGFTYHGIGDATYYTEGFRQRHRVLTLVKAVGNKFRVFQDGDLTVGVRAGTLDDGDTTYTYAGTSAQAVTDDNTNYAYLSVVSGALALTINTTGFPNPSATPHLPLATITAASGAITAIADCRSQAVFCLLDGWTAALRNAAIDLVPYLALTGTDDTDGTGSMSIQAKDAAGNNLAARFRVRTWRSGSEYGAPAAATDFSVTTGTQLRELTANADYEAISDATGLVLMNIQDAGAHYIMAEIDGRIYTGSVTITGP